MAGMVIGVVGAYPDNSTTGIHPSVTHPSGIPTVGNGSPAEYSPESSGSTVFAPQQGLNLTHALNQSAEEKASPSSVPTQKASPLVVPVLAAIAFIGIMSAIQRKGRL